MNTSEGGAGLADAILFVLNISPLTYTQEVTGSSPVLPTSNPRDNYLSTDSVRTHKHAVRRKPGIAAFHAAC